MDADVIVIGAGAAGLMCAAQAGQRGRRVLVLDHATRLAEKIRISGGGRCNFTNRRVGPEHYLSRNPHFCRSALSRYTQQDFIALVERHRIRYHEREHGQLFCDDSAQQIIDMLVAECERAGVRRRMGCAIQAVESCDAAGARFRVRTNQGNFQAASVVVASGGLSIPKIGATPLGYRIAEQFGLAVVPPRPALVPLTLDPAQLGRLQPLAGASFEAEARCGKQCFREQVLLTHRGLSGPAILQVSSYWQAQAPAAGQPRAPIHLNLLPDTDASAWLDTRRTRKALLGNVLAERLPQRFATAWAELHGWQQPIHQIPAKTLAEIARSLADWPLHPSGTQGYAKAEVTLGGVDTASLSQKTMEARTVPGLFFVGEVMDVTGHLGGYNFQWAWSSGVAAGLAT